MESILYKIQRLVIVLVLLLPVVACQGLVVSAKKAPGYDRQVQDLTVLYFARDSLDVAATGTGAYVHPTREEAQGWLKTGNFAKFSEALAQELPAAFKRHGVQARFERVEKLPATLDAYAPGHVLVIDPYLVTVGTVSGGVQIAETLFEPKRDDFVWQAIAVVLLTLSGEPGAEGARSFSERATAALSDHGLVPKASKE